MNGEAWRGTLVVAENCARQLLHRRIPWFLVAGALLFYVPPFFASSWIDEPDVIGRVISLTNSALTLLGYSCFFLSVNLYDSDASRRTLVAVMVHPIDTWAFVLGRLLGLMGWYLTLAASMLLAAAALAVFHGAVPDLSLVTALANGLVRGLTWITIGGSLATIVAPFASVVILVALIFAELTFSKVTTTAPLAMQYIKQFFYFASLVSPSAPAASPSQSRVDGATSFDALQGAENLLYAATVFIVCVAVLHRRDVPTRGG